MMGGVRKSAMLALVLLPLLAVAMPGSAAAMELSFEWGPTKSCFDPNSPPIRLKDVPKGTKRIRFHMKDLDAPLYPHGGGAVRYTGKNVFPYGTFRYKGPCPPSRHRYRITAEALDAQGRVLAKASAVRPFP